MNGQEIAPPTISMYVTARRLIKTGDLIAVRGTSLFARLQSLVTGSPYTHVGVALWVGTDTMRRLFVAQQSAAGGDFVLADTFEHEDFDVYECPVDRLTVEEMIFATWEMKVAYDWLDLLRIGVSKLLTRAGHPGAGAAVLPREDDERMVCSSRAALLYRLAGWKPEPPLPSLPAPGDVVEALGARPFFFYRPEPRHA